MSKNRDKSVIEATSRKLSSFKDGSFDISGSKKLVIAWPSLKKCFKVESLWNGYPQTWRLLRRCLDKNGLIDENEFKCIVERPRFSEISRISWNMPTQTRMAKWALKKLLLRLRKLSSNELCPVLVSVIHLLMKVVRFIEGSSALSRTINWIILILLPD